MAKDVLALMDAMGIDQAGLVGHSTGGAIGQHIALDQPERLSKLVLSCSWAGPDEYLTQLFRTRREILISCGPLAYLTMGTLSRHAELGPATANDLGARLHGGTPRRLSGA